MAAPVLCTVFLGPTQAAAGDLKNLVSDLFGGDGIAADFFGPDNTLIEGDNLHFTLPSIAALSNLSDSISSGLQTPSVTSTATGFTFDLERGIPVQVRETLGPLLVERAATVGANKLNLGFSYSRSDFKTLNGDDLSDLSLNFSHDLGADGILNEPFESDQLAVDLDLELEQNVFAFFATYGVNRHWDMGFVLPIVHVRVRADGEASIVEPIDGTAAEHLLVGGAQTLEESDEDDATGVGDIILRTKYDMSDMAWNSATWWPDLAVLAEMTLPTGNEDDLLGTGDLAFATTAIASKEFGWFVPHLNLGYEVTTGVSENDSLRYVAGFDIMFDSDLAVGAGVVGLWHLYGAASDDLVDFAIGAKWDPFDLVPINTVIRVPINKDTGLRPDFVWMVGFEYNF